MSEEGQKEILVKKILYDDLFENLAGWGVIKSQVVKTIKGRRKKKFLAFVNWRNKSVNYLIRNINKLLKIFLVQLLSFTKRSKVNQSTISSVYLTD